MPSDCAIDKHWPRSGFESLSTVRDPLILPPAIRRSNALHQRVQLFAAQCESPKLDFDTGAEFDRLALDIAHFQVEHSPGFARLAGLRGSLEHLSQLPLVPSDAFRLCRVALHPKELDQVTFRTSGTTQLLSGQHPVRDLKTKEELTLIQARRTLFYDHGPGIVVALADTKQRFTSSLGHMMALLMEHFDGRPLLTSPAGARFSIDEPGRWLISQQGIDVESLRRAARLARHRNEPFYVLSTAFALVGLLDALDGETVKTPARTRVMLTGGFKGKSRSVDEASLRSQTAQAFCISENSVRGEYGMTELSSQLFEQRLELKHEDELYGGSRWWERSGPPGIYFAPPWLRVQAVDPTTYVPVADDEPGLAHFIDLANVDSCLSVVTQDLICLTQGGVRLLGRAPRAESRGCSLPFEGFVTPPTTSGKIT